MPAFQMQPEPARQHEQQHAEEQRRQEELWAAEERRAEARRQVELQAAEQRRAEARRQVELQAAEQVRIKEQRRAQLHAAVSRILTDAGYNPPSPPPLAIVRATRKLDPAAWTNPARVSEYESLWIEQQPEIKRALVFEHQLRKCMVASMADKGLALLKRISPYANEVRISLEMPEVSPQIKERMRKLETFLAQDWAAEKRGTLSFLVDNKTQQTILHIGVGEFGPLYLTLEGILDPEALAHRTIDTLLGRLQEFRKLVDPLAVINGEHQTFNYNHQFSQARVIRAPSGDMNRLLTNMAETAHREKLLPTNTAIVNSAPTTLSEYQRIFRDDEEGASWPRWTNEASAWETRTIAAGFATAPEARREALIAALEEKKNVIVIVAHCDHNELLMPAPPPDGTKVTAEYIYAHKAAISANKPFVYLFSCQAARLREVQNFASVLLDCGASGVVASQQVVTSADGQDFLSRLLGDKRQPPPVEDVWKAMRETNYREMEVFLA
ncbi:MAG: hypothetical protein JO189_01475 [Deltaproteobacteria bacterium]|nr:hypothetical protein [Deltaproteobacteria bacterium]